jgi:hypothetical protein
MRELYIGNKDEEIMYIVLNDGSVREVYYEKYTDKNYINGKKSKYDTNLMSLNDAERLLSYTPTLLFCDNHVKIGGRQISRNNIWKVINIKFSYMENYQYFLNSDIKKLLDTESKQTLNMETEEDIIGVNARIYFPYCGKYKDLVIFRDSSYDVNDLVNYVIDWTGDLDE